MTISATASLATFAQLPEAEHSKEDIGPPHRERRPEERFLKNCTQKRFEELGWNTARLGLQAFDFADNPIPAEKELFPVFVSKREWLESLRINAPKDY